MNRHYSRLMWAGAAAVVAALAGCGGYDSGGGGNSTPPAQQVASISVTPTDATIAAGETQQFKAVAKNSSGGTVSGKTVTWHSSDRGVATIDSSGMATAVAAGTTAITATTTVTSGGGPYGGGATTRTITSNEATLTVSAAEQMTGTAAAAERGTQMLVLVHDASGNTQAALTDETGRFALSVAGMQPPFLVQARDGMGRHVYSVGTKAGVVNINPATDFLARAWFRANGMNADTAFAQRQSLAALDGKTLAGMNRALTQAFHDSLVREGLAPKQFSFFNTAAADGGAYNRLIDQMQARVTDAALTIRDSVSGRQAEAVIGPKQTATLKLQNGGARQATEVDLLAAN